MIPWTRIEPDSCDETLREGLCAEVHDALWMLARQWQMGEFRGEDVGTPVLVRCRTAADPLQVLIAGGRAVTIAAGGDPVESLVEREGPETPDAFTQLLGGTHFSELMTARRLGAAAKRCISLFPLPSASGGADVLAAFEAAATQVADAEALHAALRQEGSAAMARRLRITRRQEAAFAEVAATWLHWYGSRRGDDAGLGWSATDWMHHAALRTGAGAELRLDRHEGGALEWCALDARQGAAPEAEPANTGDAEMVPLPLQIPGTGALRFWEMEDAQVDLGTLGSGSTEIARVVLGEFALLWGHDWFVVPLELPSGVLASVQRVTVTDTFGVLTEVAPALAGGGFGLWRHAGLPCAASGLWLPEGGTLGAAVPLERLDILFDEGGNRLWASETKLVGPLALPIEGLVPTPREAPSAPAPGWRYRPFTLPPPGHVPLAVREGRVEAAELLLGDTPVPALQTVLVHGLALRADQLRTEGLSLTRQWAVLRRRDGQLVAWIARRRQALPPTTSATLVFDSLER